MRRGRPTKLTPETQERILKAIREGNYREVAAQWAGVAPETLYRWLSRDREPYRQFRHALLEAEQAAEIRMVARIMKMAEKDPNHAKWWLERKFPDRWGRRPTPSLEDKKKIVEELLSGLSEKARRQVYEILADAEGL